MDVDIVALFDDNIVVWQSLAQRPSRPERYRSAHPAHDHDCDGEQWEIFHDAGRSPFPVSCDQGDVSVSGGGQMSQWSVRE